MKYTNQFRILTNVLIYFSLIILTIFSDYLLHLIDMVWVGRYLGPVGTLLILLSFTYSLRKRKFINFGAPKGFLKNHEVLGWFGTLLILIHGGIHFNAVIPWLALIAMLVVVASGLTGKYLLKSVQKDIQNQKRIENSGGRDDEKFFLYSLMVDVMKKWRSIHMPITMVFIGFALIHIITVILFW